MSVVDGKLFVLSGPSGSGKSTVIDRLLAESSLGLLICPSVTTRAPRADDQHAKKYVHMDHAEFDRMRREGKLLESAEVSGQWYGTPREPVEEALAAGRSVLLEIDVQGGMAIKRIFPDAVMIFLRAGSMDEYERRIRHRGTNSEEDIERRLAAARLELEAAAQYDYQVTNDDLDRSVGELRDILERLGGTARV
jgi:guanylate kinase